MRHPAPEMPVVLLAQRLDGCPEMFGGDDHHRRFVCLVSRWMRG